MVSAILGKLLRWAFLVASGLLLLVALSPPMQQWFNRHGWIPDQYMYGDLYNLTNLPDFKETDYTAANTLTDADKPAKRYHDITLYTIGDSFTDVDTSYYAGNTNAHIWVGGTRPTLVSLDTTKKNILVVEFIERVLQERMYWPDYQRMYIDAGFIPNTPRAIAKNALKKDPDTTVQTTPWLMARFAEQINQRLEFLLFNGKLAIWFKEAKAQLMFDLFGRVTGGVVSTNKKHLFYQFEADSTYELSAFRHLSDQRLDTLVTNLNTMRRHYRQMGFDEVYLFLIPNKVTILDPAYGTYNHQIERIEVNPRLELPVISTIDSMRRHPNWYHLGDGHWTNQGKRFWIRQINSAAARWSTER